MRYLTQIFQPIITIPKNAKIKSTEITCKSQKLLVECGLIRPTSSGLFAILPLARISLDKLEAHLHKGMESAGALRVTLPCLTAANLWKKTQRLTDSPELMRYTDRHDKKYLLAPTHEETIADLLADVGPLSYKQLPLLLYQIGNKYRDENRPKHGLLRAREFSMMDAYGAHADALCAQKTYERVHGAYDKIFKALEVPYYTVSAPSGEMGGSISHEWHIPSGAGEDCLSVCQNCRQTVLDTEICTTCDTKMDNLACVEVGHTFILGKKYSEPLQANYITTSGLNEPIIMTCYGIGVTRLLAACVDNLSTDEHMRWPKLIAPYKVMVIGPKEGSKEWKGIEDLNRLCSHLENIPSYDGEVLVDDRHTMTIGKRMVMADKMGYPYIIVCGKASVQNPPKYELHISSKTREQPKLLTLEELVITLQDLDKGLDDKIKEFA